MIIRKSDKKALAELFNRQRKEMLEAMRDDEFLQWAFEYELGNHEYIITWDCSDAIHALGFTVDEVSNDKRLLRLYKAAKKNYVKWQEENNGF